MGVVTNRFAAISADYGTTCFACFASVSEQKTGAAPRPLKAELTKLQSEPKAGWEEAKVDVLFMVEVDRVQTTS